MLILILLCAVMIYQFISCGRAKTKYHATQVQLINLYLDYTFVTRLLTMLGNQSQTPKETALSIVKYAAEYFQIDSAITYVSGGIDEDFSPISNKGVIKYITKYISDNKKSIEQELMKNPGVILVRTDSIQPTTAKAKHSAFTIYIMGIPTGFIVWVPHDDTTLTEHEIKMLQDCRNILIAAFSPRKTSIHKES